MAEDTLKKMIEASRCTVFLGGAGVSTQSGIPDFRSQHGLYNQHHPDRSLSYEEMLSIHYFLEHPDEFYRFYKTSMLYPKATPNQAHQALAKLEAEGKLEAIITQNIDQLHQKAGSRQVLELHGSVYHNYCIQCHKSFSLEEVMNTPGTPYCPCGGLIRPGIVLYGEQLDKTVLSQAIAFIRKADLLIAGGTSLVVHPAAGLIRYQKTGGLLCLINQSPTPYDKLAHLVIRREVGSSLADAAGL